MVFSPNKLNTSPHLGNPLFFRHSSRNPVLLFGEKGEIISYLYLLTRRYYESEYDLRFYNCAFQELKFILSNAASFTYRGKSN